MSEERPNIFSLESFLAAAKVITELQAENKKLIDCLHYVLQYDDGLYEHQIVKLKQCLKEIEGE